MLEIIHSLNEASSFRKGKSGLFLDSIDKTLQGADVGSQKVPEPLIFCNHLVFSLTYFFSYLVFFLTCFLKTFSFFFL